MKSQNIYSSVLIEAKKTKNVRGTQIKVGGSNVSFLAPKKPVFLFVPSDEDDERVSFFTYLLCGVVDWEMKHRPQIIHGLDVLYFYLRAILD